MCTGSCGGYVVTVNRISDWLSRKLPDFAFELYMAVGWGIDFIDPPVVSCAKIKARWGIAVSILGDPADAVVDVVEAIAEVNSMAIDCRGENSRRPADR